MNIFVSCENDEQTQSLVNVLSTEGWTVERSPPSHDPRWNNWYDSAMQQAISKADVFVSVITKGWDSSTWMAIEAECALKRHAAHQSPLLYFWNPNQLTITAQGMQLYLTSELPTDLPSLIDSLRKLNQAHHARY